MNNDRGLLSGSITILIGAVIAIMALVRGPWQVWLAANMTTIPRRIVLLWMARLASALPEAPVLPA